MKEDKFKELIGKAPGGIIEKATTNDLKSDVF